MKGTAEIKLFNERGRMVLNHVEENMITNAISEILSYNPFGVCNFTDNLFPIFTMMNGIYLFPNTITEDVNTVNLPTNNYPVGWAGSEVNADATVLKRGSYNSVESEILENSCKFCWFFKNTEANGEINSIALTSGLMGNSAKLEPDKKFLQIGNALRTAPLTECQVYNAKKGLFFKFTGITELAPADELGYKLNNLIGVKIDVYRRDCFNISFTQGNAIKTMTNVADSSFLGYKPRGTFTVNFTTPIPIYKYISGGLFVSAISINYDIDADKINIYGLNSNNNNIYKHEITPIYSGNQISSFSVSESVKNITYGAVDNFNSNLYLYQNFIPVIDNIIYLPYPSGAGYVDSKNGDYRYKFYRINLTTGLADTIYTEDNVQIVPAISQGLILQNEHSYYNNSFSVVDGKINRHSTPSVKLPAHDIGHNYILSSAYQYVYVNMGFLASINNLKSPITKTPDTSMQIIYTISDN